MNVRDRSPDSGGDRFFVCRFLRTAMNENSQITLHTRPVFPPAGAAPLVAPQAAPPVISYGGNLYRLVPPGSDINRQVDSNWLFFAGSAGLLAGMLAGGFLMFINAGSAAPIAPTVVERPVPIPQTIKPNCIAFCGDQ